MHTLHVECLPTAIPDRITLRCRTAGRGRRDSRQGSEIAGRPSWLWTPLTWWWRGATVPKVEAAPVEGEAAPTERNADGEEPEEGEAAAAEGAAPAKGEKKEEKKKEEKK